MTPSEVARRTWVVGWQSRDLERDRMRMAVPLKHLRKRDAKEPDRGGIEQA